MLINYILKSINIKLLDCVVDANNDILYEQLLFRDDLYNQETLIECRHTHIECHHIECHHSHSPEINLHYHSSFTYYRNIQEIQEHVWYDDKHQIVEYRSYENKLIKKTLLYDYHDNGSISCIRAFGKYEEYYDDKGNLVRRRYMIDKTKWSPWENYDTHTHRSPIEIGVEYGIVVE